MRGQRQANLTKIVALRVCVHEPERRVNASNINEPMKSLEELESWINAFYSAGQTLTTVGYGDISPSKDSTKVSATHPLSLFPTRHTPSTTPPSSRT